MYITATGMVCAVGLDAASACAAMRAGIANFVELPYYDLNGELIIGAPVASFEDDFENEERLVAILSAAVAECIEKQDISLLAKIPIIVGLSESNRPGGRDGLGASIISRIESRLNIRFMSTLSCVLAQGHTSCFRALSLAKEYFRDERLEGCVVCAVDSYINAKSLLWLDHAWRLKTQGNSDGVIPGEAAAAIWLSPRVKGKCARVSRIVGVGFSHETATVLSEEPLVGKGIAGAAQNALSVAHLSVGKIRLRMSDLTGEGYGFREQALLVARLVRASCDDLPLWHCADSLGDTGAAAGVCQLVMLHHATMQSYAPGGYAMCCTSAVTGDRAVCVVHDGYVSQG